MEEIRKLDVFERKTLVSEHNYLDLIAQADFPEGVMKSNAEVIVLSILPRQGILAEALVERLRIAGFVNIAGRIAGSFADKR